MYYVYRFLDKENNIIYVGKSKQELDYRFMGHKHLPKECYDLVYTIEYIECITESDMSIKEIYYINKYRNEKTYFNVADNTEVPESVQFLDDWKQYEGPLPKTFPNSINFLKGYSKEKTQRYNKDGTVDKRSSNIQKGISTFVESYTKEESDLIASYLIEQINLAENANQEQIRFRNLLIFVLGINLPHKSNDFLKLQYKDIFDENDCLKDIELYVGRFADSKTLCIPIRKNVQKLLLAYRKRYGLTYTANSEELLFQSRKHQSLTSDSLRRILLEATQNLGIKKNVGAESLRKTYGNNIFEQANDKLNALLFLGEIWGHERESQIIRYLGLSTKEVDFDYYFGENFSLGTIDISKIYFL